MLIHRKVASAKIDQYQIWRGVSSQLRSALRAALGWRGFTEKMPNGNVMIEAPRPPNALH
jgi:hypothetical protein